MAGLENAARRGWGFDEIALLESLGQARADIIAAQSAMRRRSGLYKAADSVIDEIDELAYLITGDKGFFALGGHSGLGGR